MSTRRTDCIWCIWNDGKGELRWGAPALAQLRILGAGWACSVSLSWGSILGVHQIKTSRLGGGGLVARRAYINRIEHTRTLCRISAKLEGGNDIPAARVIRVAIV